METEFDTDGDDKPDRVHVGVTRPKQTDTEGLKLHVIYVSSPYFAGTGGTNKQYFWNPRQELNTSPEERKHFPPIKGRSERPIISNSHTNQWIPHGYIVVHSSSPGTGLSQGCPSLGGDNESLAPNTSYYPYKWINQTPRGLDG